jgi:hypothetical protein
MKENQEKLSQRTEIYRALMNEEVKYLKAMQHIIADYVLILKNKKKGQILSAEEIGSLFGNIEEIEQIEFAFVQKMKLLSLKPKLFGIGQLFLDLVPNLNIYGDYILNFRFSDATYIRCISKEKFQQFVKEKEANSEFHLSLRQLLGTPLNHLPKYAYFIDAMLKDTPDEDSDYEKLMDAYAIMTQVYWFIQDCFAQSKSFAKLLEIQRRVSGSAAAQIPRMGRVLIREGDVRIIYGSKKKKARGRCCLMNDTYLLCRYEKGSVRSMKCIAMLPVQQTAMQSDLQNTEHAIRLFSGNSTYILVFEDKDTKESWYRTIYENAAAKAKKRPNATFPSKTLQDWLEEDLPADGIPIILKKVTQALLKKGATYDTVTNVRNSINPAKLSQIHERYIREGEECDLSTESSADLAGLLVSFFQDLEKPIFPLDAYQDIVKSKINEEKTITKCKQLVGFLPWEAKRIVKFLVEFLHIICNNSAAQRTPSPSPSVSEPQVPGIVAPDQSSTSPRMSVGWKPVTPSINTAVVNTARPSDASALSTSPRTGSNLSPRLGTTPSNVPKPVVNSVSPKVGTSVAGSTGVSPRIGAHSVSAGTSNNVLKDSRGRTTTNTPGLSGTTAPVTIAKKGNGTTSTVSPRVANLKTSGSNVVGSAPSSNTIQNNTDDDDSSDDDDFVPMDKPDKAAEEFSNMLDLTFDYGVTPQINPAESFVLAEPNDDVVQHIAVTSELSIKQKIAKVSITFAPLLLNINETNHWAPQALLLELKNMVKLYHFVANLIENTDLIFAAEPTKSIVFQNLHQEFAPQNMELKPSLPKDPKPKD